MYGQAASLHERPRQANAGGAGKLATAAVIVQALTALNPRYPAADPAAADEMAKARMDLLADLDGNRSR